MELLSIKDGGVKMVEIYGMGGIGKTTIAKAIHNRLQDRFERTIYIEGIKDKKNRLAELQEEFISKAFKEENKIYNTNEGSAEIKRRFHDKKVFVVLDDVDDGDQLKALAGGRDWFGEGTRILITTRDEQLLDAHEHLLDAHEHLPDAHRHVAKKYEVLELNSRESLKLFSRLAFNSDQPSEKFMEISKKIVKAAGGLPLALQVLGGSLSPETPEEVWEEVETKLRSSEYSKIDTCLKISYDGLSQNQKEGFLDIACFFLGEGKDNVIDIWKGCDFAAPVSTINSLLHKCLLKVDDSGRLRMHDLLRNMGRGIDSSSRLWDQKKMWEVLEERKGTYEIKGIICEGYLKGQRESFDAVHSLVPPEQERATVDVEAFPNMSNLQLLILKNINLKGDFSRMPRSLRSLDWTGCSMKTLPDDFNIQKLGCLKLGESDIVQFWSDSCISKEKVFTNLKVLDLSECGKLKKLPDFSHFLVLEKLYLNRCYSLTDIPKSIEKLTQLKRLRIYYCRSLSTLSDSIGNLIGLRRLDLSDCRTLSALPSSIGRLTLLEKLTIQLCTSLSTLPDSIGNLTGLKRLHLSKCESLSALPDSIGNMTLLELDLYVCKSLSTLPDSIGNLRELRRLNLNNCVSLLALPSSIGRLTLLEELDLTVCKSLSTLPDSIGNLTGLRRLGLSSCESLSALPDSIKRLTLLEELILEHCTCLSTLPDSIGNLTGLRRLNLSSCKSLSALPSSIERLTLLDELQLKFCTSLSTLPDAIANLTGLRRLDLFSCYSLSALPDSIGKLTLLEELRLSQCTTLSTLPDSIGNLMGLRRLDLFDCESLLALPDSIGRLALLEELNLSFCTSLSTLPDSIGNLIELRRLDLFKCKSLSALPSSIGRLTLLELKLRNCRSLSTLPDSIENLTRLRELDLSCCISLSALPDSIGNLTLLEELKLYRCTSLSTLPSSIGNMRSLSTLVLSKSGIEELPDSVRLLESLKWLDIGRCRLRSRLPLSEMKCLKVLVIHYPHMDDEDKNEACEIPYGIIHYSRHTQECRRIRYLKDWRDLCEVFELSIWVVSGRERKVILLVYPPWKRPWLKHIFPDDFTPLHGTETLDAYASSSSAPDISEEQLRDIYHLIRIRIRDVEGLFAYS